MTFGISCSNCAECEKHEKIYNGVTSTAALSNETTYPKQEYCYEALDAILENDSSEVIVEQDSGSFRTVTFYNCDE